MKAREHDPAITSFPDHDVITPPNRLREAMDGSGPVDTYDKAIARAEAALAGLAHEFSAWMAAECERLVRARREVAIRGFTGFTRDALFRAAHDIKGQAETFGYPCAGEVAESLCRLVEQAPDAARIPRDLLDQHVDAIGAILREANAPNADAIAAALAMRLREATDEFLAAEERCGRRHLDDLFSPPLAPAS
jgi:HPt (histidine-containing phosphotransfer) domain-containing protein